MAESFKEAGLPLLDATLLLVLFHLAVPPASLALCCAGKVAAAGWIEVDVSPRQAAVQPLDVVAAGVLNAAEALPALAEGVVAVGELGELPCVLGKLAGAVVLDLETSQLVLTHVEFAVGVEALLLAAVEEELTGVGCRLPADSDLEACLSLLLVEDELVAEGGECASSAVASLVLLLKEEGLVDAGFLLLLQGALLLVDVEDSIVALALADGVAGASSAQEGGCKAGAAC